MVHGGSGGRDDVEEEINVRGGGGGDGKNE